MSTIKVDTLQTRAGTTAAVTGAGFVATDQIKGNTTATTVTLPTTTNIGATAIVSASAGSATIIAEGGTNTTNLQQGLAKAWVNTNGTSTAAIRDSFNVASMTDNGTGNQTHAWTNDFSNDDYSFGGFCSYTGSRVAVWGDDTAGGYAFAAGSLQMKTSYVAGTDGTGTPFDCLDNHQNIHGDLA
jgi:hypothetical protein